MSARPISSQERGVRAEYQALRYNLPPLVYRFVWEDGRLLPLPSRRLVTEDEYVKRVLGTKVARSAAFALAPERAEKRVRFAIPDDDEKTVSDQPLRSDPYEFFRAQVFHVKKRPPSGSLGRKWDFYVGLAEKRLDFGQIVQALEDRDACIVRNAIRDLATKIYNDRIFLLNG